MYETDFYVNDKMIRSLIDDICITWVIEEIIDMDIEKAVRKVIGNNISFARVWKDP